MAYTISPENSRTINLAPETLVEEVLQNVSMILSSLKNTVPLYRDFGLSARFLDMATPAAKAILIGEVYDAIEKYEPRAEIISVSFTQDELTGKLTPRLEVEINGG